MLVWPHSPRVIAVFSPWRRSVVAGFLLCSPRVVVVLSGIGSEVGAQMRTPMRTILGHIETLREDLIVGTL